MTDGTILLSLMAAIFIASLWAVRRGGSVPPSYAVALLLVACLSGGDEQP